MNFQLFLAHGPDLSLILGMVFVWLLLSYGAPLLVWTLAKRKKKIAAITLGIFATAFTGYFAFSREGAVKADSLLSFMFFGGLPFAFSVATLVLAIRSRPTSDKVETPEQ